ncbi:MAG: hypothetical protein M1516_00980 [Firmicutes bacterium]|nr:hypothetical protein [Bacillota bacterium]
MKYPRFLAVVVILAIPAVLVYLLLFPLVGHRAGGAPELGTVGVRTGRACRLPALPAWTRSPTVLTVGQENPYLHETALTYLQNGLKTLTVWDEDRWVIAVSNPSTFSYAPTDVEAALAAIRLPGRGRALWLLSKAGWSLDVAWCRTGRAYQIFLPKAPGPESAPAIAAVLKAWSRTPAARFRCQTQAAGTITCEAVH